MGKLKEHYHEEITKGLEAARESAIEDMQIQTLEDMETEIKTIDASGVPSFLHSKF